MQAKLLELINKRSFLISGTSIRAFLSVSVTCILEVMTSHGLMKNIDTKAKCRHLKKLTLRQVFMRVYRRRYTVNHVSIFDPAFFNCCLFPLLFGLTLPPPPFPEWISILYTRKQCVRGGGSWGSVFKTDTCRKVRLQVNFLYDDILHCLL